MWKYNGNIIKTPKQMTIENITYPKEIFTKWSATELEVLGITKYDPPAPTYDEKYYWGENNPKDIAPIKERMQQQVIDTAKSIIDQSTAKYSNGEMAQWSDLAEEAKMYVVSNDVNVLNLIALEAEALNIEAGAYATEIHSKSLAYAKFRVSVIAIRNQKQAEIEALSTIEEVIKYENFPVVETRKTKHTSEDGTETYGEPLVESNRNISKVNNYGWVEPLGATPDPAFVSIKDA